MKKLWTMAMAAVMAVTALAEVGKTTPKGFTDDFDAAVKSAEKSGKNLWVLFTGSDWCYWCQKLEKEVLSKPEFVAAGKDRFEFVFLDFPNDETLVRKELAERNQKLARDFGVRGYPSIFIVDSKGCKLGSVIRPEADGDFAEYFKNAVELVEQRKARMLVKNWRTLGHVRVGSASAIKKASTRLVTASGNPMLGMFLGGFVQQLPEIKELGPQRKGEGPVYVLFCDEKCEIPEYAILHPVVAGRKKFLDGNPGAVEKDGVIEMKLDGELSYLVFSKDDKWVAVSDIRAQALQALEVIPELAKPMAKNEVASFKCKPEQVALSFSRKVDEFRDFSGFSGSLCVDDRGIEARFDSVVKPGSVADAAGKIALPAKPFEFAGRDSLSAFCFADKSGYASESAGKVIQKMLAFLAGRGVELPFLKVAEAGSLTTLTIDTGVIVDEAQMSNTMERVGALLTSDKKFGEELSKVCKSSSDTTRLGGPSQVCMKFSGKGCDYCVGELYEATFGGTLRAHPKAKTIAAAMIPVYGLVRSVVASLVGQPKLAERSEEVKELLELLPPVPKTAAGYVIMREGDRVSMRILLPMDEIKALGVAGTIISSQLMQSGDKSDDEE